MRLPGAFVADGDSQTQARQHACTAATRRHARLTLAFNNNTNALQWTNPQELHGVGKYASDAYYMFCRGQWREVQPEDKDLRRYRDWLLASQGQGMGFQQEPETLWAGEAPQES